jgi:hypothetical protein
MHGYLNLQCMALYGREDTQHYDVQPKDIHHNATQHTDIQHNNKI